VEIADQSIETLSRGSSLKYKCKILEVTAHIMDTTLESILLNRRIRIGIINFYFEYLAKMASKTNILPVYTDWGNYLTLGENFA
jgi:hypothetical protein